MDELDLLVIVAESLPFPQALNLMKWYMMESWCTKPADYRSIMHHPSVQWWISKYAHEMCILVRDPNWFEKLR